MQTADAIDGRMAAAPPSGRACMLSPQAWPFATEPMTIGEIRSEGDDQTDRQPLTTLRDATDVLTQQDVGRTIPAKFLLRKSTTPAWIAMIATELN